MPPPAPACSTDFATARADTHVDDPRALARQLIEAIEHASAEASSAEAFRAAAVAIVVRLAGRDTLRALPPLSPRERDLAALVALGYTNREIAGALGLSAATVRNRLHTLFAKVEVTRRAELAGRLGLCRG